MRAPCSKCDVTAHHGPHKAACSKCDVTSSFAGKSQNGTHDGFYGDQSRFPGPPYRASSVMDSSVGRQLSGLSQRYGLTVTGEERILGLRQAATVRCPSAVRQNRSPCENGPCLFNLDADPCETNNLAHSYINIASHLFDLLKYYKLGLKPQINQPADPLNANPMRFNNSWQSWVI